MEGKQGLQERNKLEKKKIGERKMEKNPYNSGYKICMRRFITYCFSNCFKFKFFLIFVFKKKIKNK